MPCPLPPARLALALLAALPAFAAAQASPPPQQDTSHDAHPHGDVRTLDTLEVTASPLGGAVDELVRPVEILSGPELDARRAGTLGDTVDRLPGVQSSFFGAGVGRPIIRGQDGARVQVLSGGTSSLDVSTVSVDHAVTIEPFLADQIEVLKGPATLLYGSGAIGGAVNVVDGRIPTTPAGRALAGRAELRHDGGSDGDTAMARIDADAGRMTIHADLFRRDSGDYRIPGTAFSPALVAEELAEGEDPGHFARRRLPNSALTTEGGALGASWFGERGWFGAAASTYRSDYGIPPGAHAHEEGAEGEAEAPGVAGGHEDAPAEGEEFVRIDMRQDRFEARGGLRDVGPLAELNLRMTRSRYEHTEFEGEEVGTVFENLGTEVRVEAVQKERAGWRGVFGIQRGRREFSAIGAEAFVPASVTGDIGVFVLQERDFGDFKLELGARHERVDIDPDGPADAVDQTATSLAAGARWEFSERVHLSVNLDRAQRAPTAEELFSDGPHIATQSYEIGDPGLDTETATSAELGLHLHHGTFEGKVSVYRTRFDDFIYLAETGEEDDHLPVRRWVQGNATFTGWEAEGRIELHDGPGGLWDLRLFADGVEATLDGGGRVPRIAPGRVGADLQWSRGAWRARIGAVRVADQDDVATLESSTRGYTLVDAGLAWHHDIGPFGLELFVEGRNLTDQDARAHTSFLKDVAPRPGRSIATGVRVAF